MRISEFKLEKLVDGILKGDRVMLGKAITLIESRRNDHQELAQQVLNHCIPHAGNSLRIGITGAPGVGKSTFIETFGLWLTEQNRKPAVLAIDPSSHHTKGSILGDKTRMQNLSVKPEAFIRPSPSGDVPGGVAHKTREVMILCEAAGFDTVIIETVGVGQSEISVHSMVDIFILLIQPGSGDELQGIKRGIVEMADILAVTKADGELLELAVNTHREFARALHLFPGRPSTWTPRVITCSGKNGHGIEDIWNSISDFHQLTLENNWFHENRKQQMTKWLHEIIDRELHKRFYSDQAVQERLPQIGKKLSEGKITATSSANELLELYFRNKS